MKKFTLLKPVQCCLHVIDPQKSLMAQIHQAEQVARVIRLMVSCARILGVPIITNTQYQKGLGPYVDLIEEVTADIERLDKTEFGAHENQATCRRFETLAVGVDTIIMTGVETHICVYQSAMGALARGFTPWIVADGVSSRSERNHRLGLERLRQLGAIVGPAEMIIYELLGKAGTPEFKQVLPHIIEFGKEASS